MPDASKIIEKAEKLLLKGKPADAIEVYKQALAVDPNNDGIVEIIADLYQKTGQTGTALECYAYLFDKHVEKNDGNKAILDYRKMSRLGAPDPNRQLIFARLLEKTKPQESAEQYEVVSRHFREKGDKAKILETAQGLARLDADNADLQTQLAEAALEAGQPLVAAPAFLKAAQLLRRKPGNPISTYLPLLDRANDIAPHDRAVAMELAAVVMQEGKGERCLKLLEPFLAEPDLSPEVGKLAAQAAIAGAKWDDAARVLWKQGVEVPGVQDLLIQTGFGYITTGQGPDAVNLLTKLKEALHKEKKLPELITAVETAPEKVQNTSTLQEFLCSLYLEQNQAAKANKVMERLFDLYFAEGNFHKSADIIERLIDADYANPDHHERLKRLTGKIDNGRWQGIASRAGIGGGAAAVGASGGGAAQPASDIPSFAGDLGTPALPSDDDFSSALSSLGASWGKAPEAGSSGADQVSLVDTPRFAPAGGRAGAGTGPVGAESNTLEDLLLQAEIFIQYGMKPKAIERLERVLKVFPGEDLKNDKLRMLMSMAGLQVRPAGPGAAAAAAAEDEIDVSKVSEITRNINRQGTVKQVLFTAVNDIGRTWKSSKCMAALCTPGKTPSALLEYCGTGMKQSDAVSLVKLVHGTMKLTADGSALSVDDAETAVKMQTLQSVVKATSIKSLVAVPLMEADQQLGIVVLEQCDARRQWKAKEVNVLKSVVEQMAMAISHVKLRSLMKTLAVTDEKTGMLNRGSYLNCLIAETKRAQEQNGSFCIALVQFGKGNQLVKEAGEDGAKKFIEEVGQAMTTHLRPNDVAIKYDSTTLALVMPDTKGPDALQVVDKLRKLTGGIRLGEKASPPITCGLAEPILGNGNDPIDSVTELINRAEDALSLAHKDGLGTGKLLAPALT